MKPLVSFVILTWNNYEDTDECINSLKKIKDVSNEIILVDNNSTDNSIERLSKKHRTVKIIKNEKNMGFAGLNSGMKNAKGEYVAILNNDLIFQKNWINELIKPFNDKSIGITVSKLVFYERPKSIQYAGGKQHILGFAWPDKFKQNAEIISEDEEVCYGGLLLIKKEVVKKIGYFYEKLFLYHCDTDYCWRARLAGYRIIFAPKSAALHKVKFNKNDKLFDVEKNRWILILSNYKIRTLILLLPMLLLGEIGVIYLSLKEKWLKKKLKSYYEIIKLGHEIRMRRKEIDSIRAKSDKAIMEKFTPIFDYSQLTIPIITKVFNPITKNYWRIIKKLV